MSDYLSVRGLPVEGQRVFLRLDLNVPVQAGVISDDTRIREALSTIEHLLSRNAAVVACSHMGRPKGQRVPELSLAPAAQRLRELLPGRTVVFTTDTVGPEALQASRDLRPGELLLLENIRFEPGETKGDEALAGRIREMAECYVSDAFGAVHRRHASVAVAPPLFPWAAAGFLLEREIEFLVNRLGHPEHPYTAFLGGAKVSDKIPVLKRLSEKVDRLCIGGAMAYTLLAAKGISTGRSLMEPDLVEECRLLLENAASRGVQVLLPIDHVAASSLDDEAGATILPATGFPDGLSAFDIGPETARLYAEAALSSKTVFWNGPMGVFERAPFSGGTLSLARAVADSEALSVIGGGDSVAAVNKAGVAEKISHISTGGGAALELIAGETLPGLEALTKR